MSQSILEKVAKVIFEKSWKRKWNTAESYERDHYFDLVKAAIGALRDIPEDYFINKHEAFIWKDTIDRICKDIATGK